MKRANELIPTRYTYVDLMRGLAALAIVIYHYDIFLEDDRMQPFYALLWPAYDYGYVAVPLFWCLSGFVLAATYIGKQVSIGKFFVWRFSRLYPLHFVTLLYVAVTQWAALTLTGTFVGTAANDLPHFVEHLFLASSWSMDPDFSFNTPIWSVSVEVLVYALFFCFCGPG